MTPIDTNKLLKFAAAATCWLASMILAGGFAVAAFYATGDKQSSGFGLGVAAALVAGVVAIAIVSDMK